MPRGEIEQRLGPHKAQTRVQFAWFRGPGLPDGGSEVSLSEETTLNQAPGGDFSVRLSNDHNQGFELVWAKGEVFVRGLYGPFRKRRTDRTDVAKIREQALAALGSFDRLARGLKLKLEGEGTEAGRKVIRYTVVGSGARAAEHGNKDLPPVEYPLAAGEKGDKGQKAAGLDPDTARRLELWEKEQPTELSGTILIDAETAAPIACDLRGHFQVVAQSMPAAELDLHSVLSTSAIGKAAPLATPKWEPEPTVPHAVKDPLRFLGKTPGAAPGAASTEEPEEDEKPDDEAPQ